MQSTREKWFLLMPVPLYLILIIAEILMRHWKGYGYYTYKETLVSVV